MSLFPEIIENNIFFKAYNLYKILVKVKHWLKEQRRKDEID